MVHPVGPLLAVGIAGADRLSVRVVDSAAFPNRGDRCAWSSGVSEGAVLPAGADIAWAARDLKSAPSEA